MRRHHFGLVFFIVLILSGCKTEKETFSSYMSDAEEKAYKYIEDPQRAEQVIAGYHDFSQLFIEVRPGYQALKKRGYQLDHAYTHNKEEYETLLSELDALNDHIRTEIFKIAEDIRSQLKEKEWKKLNDPNFLMIFIQYLEEGV